MTARPAVVALIAVALVAGAVGLWGGAGERMERAPELVALTVDPAAARAVLDGFVASLNAGDADAAFARLDSELLDRPEAIDGLDFVPFLDFDEELAYARWTAALGGERTLSGCSVERWVHRVDGVRRAEDAQLLACRGAFSSDFIAAVGLEPMPIEVIVAVNGEREISLYQEWVVDEAATAVFLEFRRWLRAHHPDDELRVFTAGGTPLATFESARLMLHHAPEFASARRSATGPGA